MLCCVERPLGEFIFIKIITTGLAGRGSNPSSAKRFFLEMSRPALGLTQPPIQCVPRVRRSGALSLLPLYAFMVWMGRALTYVFSVIMKRGREGGVSTVGESCNMI